MDRFGLGVQALGVTWIGLELILSVTDFTQIQVTGWFYLTVPQDAALQP